MELARGEWSFQVRGCRMIKGGDLYAGCPVPTRKWSCLWDERREGRGRRSLKGVFGAEAFLVIFLLCYLIHLSTGVCNEALSTCEASLF